MLMEEFREAHRKMFGSQAVLNVEQNVSMRKFIKSNWKDFFLQALCMQLN